MTSAHFVQRSPELTETFGDLVISQMYKHTLAKEGERAKERDCEHVHDDVRTGKNFLFP